MKLCYLSHSENTKFYFCIQHLPQILNVTKIYPKKLPKIGFWFEYFFFEKIAKTLFECCGEIITLFFLMNSGLFGKSILCFSFLTFLNFFRYFFKKVKIRIVLFENFFILCFLKHFIKFVFFVNWEKTLFLKYIHSFRNKLNSLKKKNNK